MQNSSLLWDTDQGIAIVYGNLIHEILSKIKTKNDISEVLSQYLFKGVIPFELQEEIQLIVNKIIDHPKLANYFEQNNVVFNEQEILTSDKKIVIPDRLVFNKNEVTIIDYKTGKPDKKYHNQINNYGEVLANLNYEVDKKILVYINDEIFIEEV